MQLIATMQKLCKFEDSIEEQSVEDTCFARNIRNYFIYVCRFMKISVLRFQNFLSGKCY